MLAVAGFALFLGNVLGLNEGLFFWTSHVCCFFLGAGDHKFMAYGALYLMVAGVSGGSPVIAAWLANNSEPHYRRATNIALILIFNSAVCFFFSVMIFFFLLKTIPPIFQGGVLGTWSFPTKDGPKFTKTITMNLVL